ncbi:unnamed protein product [Auanema sp. JU1783]|nr:unnamed protein product [Auanema sp. JU1783]
MPTGSNEINWTARGRYNVVVNFFQDAMQTRNNTVDLYIKNVREEIKKKRERLEIEKNHQEKVIANLSAQKEETIRKTFFARAAEIKEEMFREFEEGEKQADVEFNSLDITKPLTINKEPGKKTLRGRGAGPSEPVQFVAPVGRSALNMAPQTHYLLSDGEILSDLKAVNAATNDKYHVKYHKVADAIFTKQKLTYDGKNYKQGEECVVENEEYGRFPARIDFISDRVVVLKATMSWDIRQVYASRADLIEGRVLMYKKRNA